MADNYDKITYMEALTKNMIFEVNIERYNSEGMGVCHAAGRAVFVPKTIVGERWEIKILKVSSSAVYAKGEKLLSAATSRVDSKCPHFGKCGGCNQIGRAHV